MGMSLAKKLLEGSQEVLADDSGRPVTNLRIGVSWDASSRGQKGLLGRLSRKVGTDLDLEAYVLDQNGDVIRRVWGENLAVWGAITHSGDNKTGVGDGLDEVIDVDLAALGGRVDVGGLAFAVTAFKPKSSFKDAANIDVELWDTSNGSPGDQVVVYSPPLNIKGNAILFAVVDRVDADQSKWRLVITKELVQTTSAQVMSKVSSLFRSHDG